MAYNSDHFDLKNWKVTLPVDSTGGIAGIAVDVLNLDKYESAYFYDAPDGGMVFTAAVDGATTSGTKYARTELREMNGTQRAAWNLDEGGTMTATVSVDKVPKLLNGSNGKLIVGQIHGQNEELIRLYWEGNSVYFVNDQAGPDNRETKFFFKNAAGQAPSISLGEKFSYMIDARGDTLKVNIHADGQVYTSTTKINDVWQSDTFYFKAGTYLGVNETQGTGSGQTSFYGLDFGHTTGSGLGGLNPSQPDPEPEPQPNPQPTPGEVNGTAGNDTLGADPRKATIIHGLGGDDMIIGRDGGDTLYGDAGNDTIKGYWGNDTIVGGTGKNIVTGGPGNDTFVLSVGENLVITDFSAGDKLVAKGFTTAMLAGAELTQAGTNAVLTLSNGTTVTFTGVKTAQLNDSNLQAEIDGQLTGLLDAGNDPNPNPNPTPNPETPPADAIIGTAGDDKLEAHQKNGTYILGGDGDDYVIGHDGNDKLYGQNGNDTINGYWGNDIIDGGMGSDRLSGGPGADTYVFKAADVGKGVDAISGLSLKDGDKLDLSDVLQNYDPMTEALSDFVKVTSSGSTRVLSVDTDGAGSGSGWVTVATISSTDITADIEQLAQAGKLIV